MPVFPLCNQGILQYCIFTPSDKPCGLIHEGVSSITLVTTLVNYMVQPTVKVSNHKQISMSSDTCTCL